MVEGESTQKAFERETKQQIIRYNFFTFNDLLLLLLLLLFSKEVEKSMDRDNFLSRPASSLVCHYE